MRLLKGTSLLLFPIADIRFIIAMAQAQSKFIVDRIYKRDK